MLKNGDRLVSVAHDYVSFMALIGSLFVAAGGIHITVKGESRPIVNVLFLLTGAIVADVIGTTGASMLMIRPWIRMNRYRITAFHVIFFIFIVSNVGGCVTPLGDPPLFLGYLKGVPFLWVLENCWKPWLVVVGSLLAIFYILDSMNFRQATQGSLRPSDQVRNLAFCRPSQSDLYWAHRRSSPGQPAPAHPCAGTCHGRRGRGLILQHVGLGPQLERLRFRTGQGGRVALCGHLCDDGPSARLSGASCGRNRPAHGSAILSGDRSLSAFLDNAPTYLTFLAAAMANQGLNINSREDIASFIQHGNEFLVAISLGAVFFGAGTYIGNGPNFMVKNIAQQVGVRTPARLSLRASVRSLGPTFFGYVFRYTLPVLALVALLCFSRWRIF